MWKVCPSSNVDLMIKVCRRKKATRKRLKTRGILQVFASEGCFFPVFGRFRLFEPLGKLIFSRQEVAPKLVFWGGGITIDDRSRLVQRRRFGPGEGRENQENCKVVRSSGFSRLPTRYFRLKEGLRTTGGPHCSSPGPETCHRDSNHLI
jgi:hypothetical protein